MRIESGSANPILTNSIFSNGTLGIDLGTTGVTPNDARDADSGANNLQNFPVLTSVTSAGSIQGTLDSTASTTFTVEFFASSECDPSGSGEGQRYLGAAVVTTDASGHASFTASLGALPAGAPVATATATGPAGNTSELSACQNVMLAIEWQSPDPASAAANPPPRFLVLAEAAVAARGGAALAGYRVYASSRPNVDPVAGNLVRELGSAETSTSVPLGSGAMFLVVTAVYADGGESAPSNEISVGLPFPTVTSITVTNKKLIAVGTGFTSQVEVFVDGVGFAPPAKVKRGTKVIQKGALESGQTIGAAIGLGQTVALSFRNADGGTATVIYTRP